MYIYTYMYILSVYLYLSIAIYLYLSMYLKVHETTRRSQEPPQSGRLRARWHRFGGLELLGRDEVTKLLVDWG